MKIFASYTRGETQTAGGQLVGFTCSPEDREEIQKFIGDKVRTIEEIVTHTTNVQHGGYGSYSRFKIKQHKYAGGGAGYIEAIEVENAPDGRNGYVVHEYSGGMTHFVEFKSMANACSFFDSFLSNGKREYSTSLGFIRRVECGTLTPWFYAIGEQLLTGDFAFPESGHDDLTYRFGKKFVVFDYEGKPEIKTVMMAFRKKHTSSSSYSSRDIEQYTLHVVWNDGSISPVPDNKIRPLRDDELWIHAAMQSFRDLLAGGDKRFEIPFTTGGKFIGRFADPPTHNKTEIGRYWCEIETVDGEEMKGWVKFNKTAQDKYQTIEEYIKSGVKTKGKALKKIVMISNRQGQRAKWHAVFEKPEIEESIG